MPKKYVAFFPELEESSWISKFRHEHDMKSALVAPHMTLVFPTDVDANELRKKIEIAGAKVTKFAVQFRSCLLMPEKSANGFQGHIFLVPDEGFSQVVRLHTELYSGNLRPWLRLDIPFVPHITIGSGLELEKAKALVDELNSQRFDVEFLVDRLTIVEINDPLQKRVLHSYADLK